jgi:predicted phosphodiesterase
MFKKHSKYQHRRRGYGPFRLILSLIMMSVLGLGVYSAAKAFSGIDPLKISPKLAGENLLVQLLSFSPETIFKSSDSTSVTSPASTNSEGETLGEDKSTPKPKKELAFKFAVVTDSHNDNQDLKKALSQAKEAGAKFAVGLGDYSDVGTLEELKAAKATFDASGLPFYLIPGDHDLWDSRNKGLPPTRNFSSVFGPSYQSFSYQQYRFIMIDNSDNYLGLSNAQLQWITDELGRVKSEQTKGVYAFTSTPLYHPSSDHVMGKVEPKLKAQAENIISQLKAGGVAEVFSGDTHFYASFLEPKNSLHMTVSGAVTATRNLQVSRFLLIDQFSDGSYNIQDLEVKQ